MIYIESSTAGPDEGFFSGLLGLIAMRADLAVLVAEWKAAGGSEHLPTIEERFKANNRPAQKPKAATAG
jgi:hypothetical protein